MDNFYVGLFEKYLLSVRLFSDDLENSKGTTSCFGSCGTHGVLRGDL